METNVDHGPEGVLLCDCGADEKTPHRPSCPAADPAACPDCGRTDAHRHCNECGATDHGAAYCDMEW